jgi:hypothetical protein
MVVLKRVSGRRSTALTFGSRRLPLHDERHRQDGSSMTVGPRLFARQAPTEMRSASTATPPATMNTTGGRPESPEAASACAMPPTETALPRRVRLPSAMPSYWWPMSGRLPGPTSCGWPR